MSESLTIALFQYDIQWLSPQENINLLQKSMDILLVESDLVVLPEMCITGFCMDANRAAIRLKDPMLDQFNELSIKYETGIIGSFATLEGGHYFNSVILFDGEEQRKVYDKKYLYTPSGENKQYSSSDKDGIFEFKGFKIMPQVCYDLRFPENVRQHDSPDVLLYLANWPKARIQHWDTLLQARAIENQCYVAACNRLGVDGNEWEYPGHSQLIQYDGTIMKSGKREGFISQTLFKSEQETYRSTYQFLKDRKKVNVNSKEVE